MKTNYPATSLNYLHNKLLLFYNALQVISNTKLFNVNQGKTNQFFTPELSFSLKNNNKIFIEIDVFKSHPLSFLPNLFYTISGSAIFCNLSVIMRHSLTKPIAVYTHQSTANNAHFQNIKNY